MSIFKKSQTVENTDMRTNFNSEPDFKEIARKLYKALENAKEWGLSNNYDMKDRKSYEYVIYNIDVAMDDASRVLF